MHLVALKVKLYCWTIFKLEILLLPLQSTCAICINKLRRNHVLIKAYFPISALICYCFPVWIHQSVRGLFPDSGKSNCSLISYIWYQYLIQLIAFQKGHLIRLTPHTQSEVLMTYQLWLDTSPHRDFFAQMPVHEVWMRVKFLYVPHVYHIISFITIKCRM